MSMCLVVWGSCPDFGENARHGCFLAAGHGHNHACVCGNTDLEPHEQGDTVWRPSR